MRVKRSAYRVLVEKPEGKRPQRKLRRKWGINVKTDLRGIIWDGMNWINLAENMDQKRIIVNTIMNLRVP
jgi:hypothetical protein